MLAHLLKDSTFLGEQFIVDCLFAVFEAATHIYVRATVVDSLSAVLTSSCDERLRTQLVDGLVERVVPVAAELNERAPMNESMWTAAEGKCEPPDILNGSRGGLGPICSSLVNFFQDAPLGISESNGFAERIMKPLVERSQESNSRWTNIFLRKHNASHLEPLVPKFPAKPGLLRIMLDNYTSNMEVSIFKNLSEALLFATHPPQGIVDFAKQLKALPDLDKKHDINHWLHFTTIFRTYDHGVSSALKKAKCAPADVATKQGLLTPTHLQEHEHKALKLALDAYDTDPQSWNHYMNYYKPPVQSPSDSQLTTNWRERCRPVLQHVLRLVERSRTGMWQLDKNRHPSVLPDTFESELWLLTYPNLYPPAQHTGCLNAFCSEIRKIVEQLASSSRPYHARYTTLLTAILHCNQEDWMALALYLGDLELFGSKVGGAPLTRAELLCIDAAAHVLDEIRKQTRERDLKPAKTMLEIWKGCADEEVRRKGRELIARL